MWFISVRVTCWCDDQYSLSWNQIVFAFDSHTITSTSLFFFAVFGNQSPNRYLINPKSTEGLMKLLDTFLLTITCRGNVVLVSSSIEQYLGHCRVSCQRYLLLFFRKWDARFESFHLKSFQGRPFYTIDIPRPKAFPTHPRSIRKHHDSLFTHRKPVRKALGECCSAEFIFFQTRSRLQVQTATNCPSPIKLELQGVATRSSRSFFFLIF